MFSPRTRTLLVGQKSTPGREGLWRAHWGGNWIFLDCVFFIELCFRILLADAAHQITNAGKEVFGDELIRIMCWSHCHSAYFKKLKALVKKSDLQDKINQERAMDDLQPPRAWHCAWFHRCQVCGCGLWVSSRLRGCQSFLLILSDPMGPRESCLPVLFLFIRSVNVIMHLCISGGTRPLLRGWLGTTRALRVTIVW